MPLSSGASACDRGLRASEGCERAAGERGASLVEFVLILPLVLIIVFGAFSGAVAFTNKQDVVYAAREGARYGVTIPQSQCSPTTNCGGKNWAQLVQSTVIARSEGEITAAEVCVSLVSNPLSNSPATPVGASFTTKTDGTACYNDGNGDPGARVQVSVSHAGSINAVFFTVPVTEASHATMHFEQQ
jgi:Flp pilus assembly protein TadG